MKNTLKKLKRLNARLKDNAIAIEQTEISTYYNIFSNEQERQKDLSELELHRKTLLNLKQVELENLQLEINKELNFISQQQRVLNLKTA